MIFPVSGVEGNPFILIAITFLISFLTSMGGVSGSFLLLPFQVSILGFNSPSVSGTNQFFNVIAIPGGVYRYFKEQRMVWPLMWVIIIGTLPGVFLGATIRVKFLPDPDHFKLFVGIVLLYIAYRLIKDLLGTPVDETTKAMEAKFHRHVKNFKKNRDACLNETEKLPIVVVRIFSMTDIKYAFYGEIFSINPLSIFIVSMIVGTIGGIYGIGGGAILAPILVGFYGLPIYTVAGATLMGTFATSVGGVVFYQTIAPFYPEMAVAPDWLLGAILGIGGILGIYCGARFQKFVPAAIIKGILLCCILIPALGYILDFYLGHFYF